MMPGQRQKQPQRSAADSQLNLAIPPIFVNGVDVEHIKRNPSFAGVCRAPVDESQTNPVVPQLTRIGNRETARFISRAPLLDAHPAAHVPQPRPEFPIT